MLGAATERTRKTQALLQCLGSELVNAIGNPDVVEIMANPDGQVWIDTHSKGRVLLTQIAPTTADNVVRLVADRMKTTITRQCPHVSGTLPTGERFQGLVPPLVERPTFTIRKRSIRVVTLDEYVEAGIMTPRQSQVLREGVATRKNIVVVGGTGSGKTTLCNALLADEGFAGHRVVLIEDTQELQCAAADSVPLLVSRSEPEVTMRDLLRLTMRLRPDRIVVGEVRGGEALDLIKAWNTGHPGGLGTLHADGALQGLKRLGSLIGEVAANVDRDAIGEAVDYVVFIRRLDTGRRVEEVLEVESWDPETESYRVRAVA